MDKQDKSRLVRMGGWSNLSSAQQKHRRQIMRQKKWPLLIKGMELIKETELGLMTEEEHNNLT